MQGYKDEPKEKIMPYLPDGTYISEDEMQRNAAQAVSGSGTFLGTNFNIAPHGSTGALVDLGWDQAPGLSATGSFDFDTPFPFLGNYNVSGQTSGNVLGMPTTTTMGLQGVGLNSPTPYIDAVSRVPAIPGLRLGANTDTGTSAGFTAPLAGGVVDVFKQSGEPTEATFNTELTPGVNLNMGTGAGGNIGVRASGTWDSLKDIGKNIFGSLISDAGASDTAVMDQASEPTETPTGFATETGAGGFTGGAQMFDMGMDPTFANTGGWGVPQGEQQPASFIDSAMSYLPANIHRDTQNAASEAYLEAIQNDWKDGDLQGGVTGSDVVDAIRHGLFSQKVSEFGADAYEIGTGLAPFYAGGFDAMDFQNNAAMTDIANQMPGATDDEVAKAWVDNVMFQATDPNSQQLDFWDDPFSPVSFDTTKKSSGFETVDKFIDDFKSAHSDVEKARQQSRSDWGAAQIAAQNAIAGDSEYSDEWSGEDDFLASSDISVEDVIAAYEAEQAAAKAIAEQAAINEQRRQESWGVSAPSNRSTGTAAVVSGPAPALPAAVPSVAQITTPRTTAKAKAVQKRQQKKAKSKGPSLAEQAAQAAASHAAQKAAAQQALNAFLNSRAYQEDGADIPAGLIDVATEVDTFGSISRGAADRAGVAIDAGARRGGGPF